MLFFDPDDPNDVIELHYHTLRPWMEREPIFSEKALHLYRARLLASYLRDPDRNAQGL